MQKKISRRDMIGATLAGATALGLGSQNAW
ncbi:MAG: twin-arginine translocation signal domain-containing protein, partial [Thermoguttaceae bacterium]|nr:twin-arginine translocation signal domain-containing protein [Thermoguttaceae bacterium]